MRDLILYAEARGIVIVPEFDMPSHSKSWFAGYPELSSSPGPFKPGVLVYQGITAKSSLVEILKALQTSQVPAFDPSSEATYQFLDRLTAEMSALFPSPYLHIGADENNGAVWLANPAIVSFMHSHQIVDAPALQAYFVSRVESIVRQHGKQMVAWEEAYTPDGPGKAIYQAWSPMAKTDLTRIPMTRDNKVLVSRDFYLDLLYPAHVHYGNDALPMDANAPPSSSLLGGEAAIWAELADAGNLESRIWPRVGAVAERLWTAPSALHAADLYPRLFQFGNLLQDAGVHHLAESQAQIARLSGSDSKEPVQVLLDVLTPLKGYKRLMRNSIAPAERDGLSPLHRVSDFVLVDSPVKYKFRPAVAAYLATHSAESESELRASLTLWSSNAHRLHPYYGHSDDLRAVSAHADRLSALAGATLKLLDLQHGNEPVSPDQMKECDALLKAAGASEAETEIAVVPEIAALLHGNLQPEPKSYLLF